MHNKLRSLILVILIFGTNLSWADKDISIAITAIPNNLVPFYSTDANSQNINRLVHLSLVEINSKMQYQCNACESYDEKMEGLKHVFIFNLKKNLTFSDGTSLKAADVNNSWLFYGKDKKINSTLMEAFENVESVEVLDPFKIKFIYKNFSLENLSNLSSLKIVKILKRNDPLEVADIVGAGEYIIEKVTPLEVTLKARANNRPKLIFKVVKDETTLALKLINKEIDLSVASISPRKVDWLKKKENILKVWDIPSANYIFIGMNQQKKVFRDKNIRMALSYLIPRAAILKYKLKNTAVLSNGMFSPAFKDFYTNRTIDIQNEKLGNDLLQRSGFLKNQHGIYEKDGEEFIIDWKVSNNKSSIETAEILKNSFEKNGIKVNITIQEWGTYMSSFKAGKFDIVVGQWIGFTGPDMLRFVFHSENIPPRGGNRIHYNNPLFDQAIDRATIETNQERRNQLYNEANKIVTDDYAYINLWHPNVIWIGSKCLKNIELEPTGSFLSLPKVEKTCE